MSGTLKFQKPSVNDKRRSSHKEIRIAARVLPGSSSAAETGHELTVAPRPSCAGAAGPVFVEDGKAVSLYGTGTEFASKTSAI
jgi:hypothetical protein